MSQAQTYVVHYIPDVSKRGKLCQVLSDADIPRIGDEMFEWEEKLVGPLGLTPREVSDLHEQFRGGDPKLKRLILEAKVYILFLWTSPH